MEERSPGKSDTLSSQVLEYFRKYSGDQNLSSYLRGVRKSEVMYKVEKKILEKEIEKGGDDEKTDQIVDREGNISPTSSLTSNRKLEWDNGADIGYENSDNRANLHKSFSLPSLTTLEKIELGRKPLKLPLESNPDTPNKIYYSSSDSTSSNPSLKPSISSSTPNSSPKEQKFDTTSSSFAFKSERDSVSSREKPIRRLFKTVGSPVCQSTPNFEYFNYKRRVKEVKSSISSQPNDVNDVNDDKSEITSTSSKEKPIWDDFKKVDDTDRQFPVKNKDESDDKNNENVKITELKCLAKFKKNKIIKLSLTKPISIDCMNYKEYNDKDIQANIRLGELKSIGVQTDSETDDYKVIIKGLGNDNNETDELIDNVGVEFVKYKENLGDLGENSSGSRSFKSIGTNTISDLVSNCDSFDYLSGKDEENVVKIDQKDKNIKELESKLIEKDDDDSNSQKCSHNHQFPSNESSEKAPLGEMISHNLSNQSKIDVIKCMLLLERLLKSKRYDKVTKEYFLKKVIEKMLRSEGYESIKKSFRDKINNDEKETEVKSVGKSTSSSSKVSENGLETSLKERLQENVPWIPSTFNKNPQNLSIKTFSSEIYPEKPLPQRKPKDSRFTLTNSILNQQLNLNNPNFCNTSKNKDFIKSWKDDLTQSEKLLENNLIKASGDDNKTDSLVKFAKKERENQLNWINDEISHLDKLRKLLEKNHTEKENKKTSITNVEVEVLTKPHVEDMKKLKKSASVYVITTDRNANRNKNVSQDNLKQTRDVREAKLVASEVYKSDKPFTCIRRYIFEIPVECGCENYPCDHAFNEQTMTAGFDYQGHSSDVGVQPDRIIHKKPSGDPILIKETYISPEGSRSKPLGVKTSSRISQNQRIFTDKKYDSDYNDDYDDAKYTKSVQTVKDKDKPVSSRMRNDLSEEDGLIPPEGFQDQFTQKPMTPGNLSPAAFTEKEEMYDKSSMTDQEKECQFQVTRELNANHQVSTQTKGPCCNCVSKQTITTQDELLQVVNRENSIDKASMTEPGRSSSDKLDKLDDSNRDLLNRSVQAFESNPEFASNKHRVHSVSEVSHLPLNDGIRVTEEVSEKVLYDKYKENSDMSSDNLTENKNKGKRSDFTRKKRSTDDEEFYKGKSVPTYSKSTPEYQKSLEDYKYFAGDPQKSNYQGRPQKTYKKYQNPSSQTNLTSSSSTSSSKTICIKICPCCNQKKSVTQKLATDKYKSLLQSLPGEIESSLCQPCHMNTKMTIDPTTGEYKMYPGHVCNCYTLMKTQTVNKIKQTVKKLEELEEERESNCNCKCSYNYSSSKKKNCKCSKKGIAYTLTLEDQGEENSQDSSLERKKSSLDEIKIKIPRKSEKRRHKKHKREKSHSRMTLQEYLYINRPNFIQNAEERRKTLIELAYMREERCQKYKQLLARTNGIVSNDCGDVKKKRGLYSSKEMKKITAKNYKKLPEVQQKLKERRENDNKKANRLLANIFNKKMQQNALKGKVDLSTTTSVIKFV